MASTANPDPITYADWAKHQDPDGDLAEIIEVMSKTNPIINDAILIEGNLDEGQETTVRAGEPRPSWVGYNEGTMPTKGHTRQVTDKYAYMQAYIECDVKIANKQNNKAKFMSSQADSHMMGMAKEHAEALFYGNGLINPKKPTGLMPRFNDTAAESSRNIVNGNPGGGQPAGGSNTSIYCITWGEKTAFQFFPKHHSSAGIVLTDKGQVTLYTEDGGRYEGYRQHLEQYVGFAVADWRSCYRIAQLDTAAINADTIDLASLLIKAQHRTRMTNMGQQVIYVNEAVYTSLDVRASQTSSNVMLNMREWHGEEVVHFRNIPVLMCEAIDDTEENVVGLTETVIS